MSGQYTKTVAAVSVGTPPDGFSFEQWSFAEVHFHDFLSLVPTDEKDEWRSPQFTCLGRQWALRLYPGGYSDSHRSANDGIVSVLLSHCSEGWVKVEYSLTARNSAGKIIEDWHCYGRHFRPKGKVRFTVGMWKREVSFARRSEIADALDNECNQTLTIEVRMRLAEATGTVPPFIPENPLRKNILDIFMDEESADVVFEVGNDARTEGGRNKRARSSPAVFHAHGFVLRSASETLAELCGRGKGAGPVRISGVDPEIFRHVLRYAYGGKVPDGAMEARARDIIDAADRFGVVNLKLEAEACYVGSVELDAENVLDNLLYADAVNCALLKESVVDFILENSGDIMGKVSFDSVPGSLVSDLLTSVTRGKRKGGDGGSDYSTMRVNTLRKKLHEKGLGIDGSREVMIGLLKENS